MPMRSLIVVVAAFTVTGVPIVAVVPDRLPTTAFKTPDSIKAITNSPAVLGSKAIELIFMLLL